MNPEAFKIIEGKLYLNWDRDAAESFASNPVDEIRMADENWNRLVEKSR